MKTDITPTFSGEVQFRRYSDTSTQGQQIVLAVADREALAPFIGKEGKRFMAVLVEIGDDEQPVQPVRSPVGPLCIEARKLCEHPSFQEWASAYFGLPASREGAKLFILDACEITSRKELDTDARAGKWFVDRVRIPFLRRMKK